MGQSTAAVRNRPLVRSSRVARVRTARIYNRYKRYAAPHLRVIKPALMRYHGPVIEQFRSISPLFVRDHRSGDFAFFHSDFCNFDCAVRQSGQPDNVDRRQAVARAAGILALDCHRFYASFLKPQRHQRLRLRGKKRADGKK